MKINLTKQKLMQDETVFGAIVNEYSPNIVELCGAVGFDFVMIDCEHGSMSVDQVENMIRGAESFDITPIARIPDHSDSTILRFLDRGIQGLIIPHVNTMKQAEQIAKASRYFPDGHRGVGGGRAHYYGVNVSRNESTAFINENILVIPMMEEVESVKNLASITSVEGIDVIHVAPGDLGQSMGNASQEDVWAVMDEIVPKIRAAGKWVGVGGNAPAETQRINDLIDIGANMVTISAHALLMDSAKKFLSGVRAPNV